MCWVSLPAHVNGCSMVLGQKFLGNPDPGFRRCCCVQHSHVQVLILMALHCHKVMRLSGCLLGHSLLSSLPGVWHLARGSQTQKDLGVQLPAFSHNMHSELSTLGCVSRALAISFEWWHRAEFRQIQMEPGSISRYLSSALQIRRCIFCRAENCQEGNLKLRLLPRHSPHCLNNLTIMGIDSWLLILTVTYD